MFAASEMRLSPENLRLVLGLKLRAERDRRGFTLQQLAARSGLAVSYLSEIEKGKKYPKPAKLLELAQALEVSYDELVSPKVGEELSPLQAFAGSDFLREFPFELFGVSPESFFGLVSGDPKRAGALLRTFAEIGQRYDVEVEHLLFAALRSYQQLQANYFPELEKAASELRERQGWGVRRALTETELEALLRERWGYEIDHETLAADRDLAGLRSVYDEGPPPRLHVNGKLLAAQRAFLLAREIGYRALGLGERAVTSSWLKVESFDQVLNNFRASYFAGALLIPESALVAQLRRFFGARTFEPQALLSALERFGTTPEMLFYRVTELAPRHFGLSDLYFVRFQRDADRRFARLTKVLNLSRVGSPHGVAASEHSCARWPGIAILEDPALRRGRGATPIRAQRSRFLSDGVEFFVVAAARPLALKPGAVTSVSLGFLVDERLRSAARFLDDPKVPRLDVDLTCERCPLSARECDERAAPASVRERARTIAGREKAIARLLRKGVDPDRIARP